MITVVVLNPSVVTLNVSGPSLETRHFPFGELCKLYDCLREHMNKGSVDSHPVLSLVDRAVFDRSVRLVEKTLASAFLSGCTVWVPKGQPDDQQTPLPPEPITVNEVDPEVSSSLYFLINHPDLRSEWASQVPSLVTGE